MPEKRRRIASAVREEVFRRARWKCEICGRETPDLDLDHLVPLAGGGGNSADNLRAVCRSCNVLKHSHPGRLTHVFEQERATAYRLERQVAEYFGNLGFAVLSDATGPDGGVDLILRKAEPLGTFFYLVECKSSRRPISAAEVRAFATKVASCKATGGLLVTSKSPTKAALEMAKYLPVRVVTAQMLSSLTEQLTDKDRG